jgi:hypothetical protein
MKVKHVDHRMSNLRTKYVGGEFAQVKVEHVDQQEEDLEAKAHLQKSNGWGGLGGGGFEIGIDLFFKKLQ